MRPTPAEIARTLAAGHLPATVQVACGPGPLPAVHAADCGGHPLLLVSAFDRLAGALPFESDEDAAAVLTVADEPPVAGAPTLGRVWVSGWVSRLEGAAAREAASEFAEINPLGDLLDVGRGHELYRLEVAEVRLECGGRTREVDAADYLAADPDPLFPHEADLLADLADHHGAEVGEFTRSIAAGAGLPPLTADDDAPVTVVRLDRYGMVVRGDKGLARLEFTRPVRDSQDLARLLHPVLFGCAHRHAAG